MRTKCLKRYDMTEVVGVSGKEDTSVGIGLTNVCCLVRKLANTCIYGVYFVCPKKKTAVFYDLVRRAFASC